MEDPIAYRKILRLLCEKFEELLEKIHPLIQKKDTLMRLAIPSRTKLEITLRYLATGDSYQFLELLFRVAACTICKFLPKVLDAIKQVLWDYLKVSLRKFINYLILKEIQYLGLDYKNHYSYYHFKININFFRKKMTGWENIFLHFYF